MKKVILIIVIFCFAKISFAQNNTYEGNANTMTNFSSSGAPTAYGLTKSYVVNAGVFSDTSQANIVNYLKNYNGAQIMTYSGGVKYWLRYGGSWNQIGGSGTSGWALTGNAGTIAGTNFLGTTDATDFYLKTNSSNAARFYTTGNIDFWSGSTPAAPFDASSFKFLKDQDLRTDIHISNRTTGHNARAGVGGSNDRGNYFLLSVVSDSFNVGVPGQENEWANKVVLQTGGNGKGLVISSNEGGMTFDVFPSDSTDTYVDFKEHAMVISGVGRHGFVTPIAAGGTIGMGITAPRAKLDVYGKTLSDAVTPDYKKALRVTAKMPTTVSSEFSAIEFNIDSANTTDKTIFEVKSTNNQVFRIDSANVTVNNKLGVGTTSPAYKLDVQSSSAIASRIQSSAYGNTLVITDPNSSIGINGTTITGYYGGATQILANGTLQLGASGSPSMYLNGSNVGIGTSTPSALLHVKKTTEQLRLEYDATHYLPITVTSANTVRFGEVGSYPNSLPPMYRFGYSGVPAYGSKGFAIADDANGTGFILNALAGGQMYITDLAGASGGLTVGELGNPYNAAYNLKSFASGWYVGTGGRFGVGIAPDSTAQINGSLWSKTLRVSNLATSTDTTTYKPAGLDANGTMVKMANWPVGSVTVPTFIYNESFTGSTSSTYTLANAPTVGKLSVFKNGILLAPTTDYTLSGTTVTLVSARVSGDVFLNNYQY